MNISNFRYVISFVPFIILKKTSIGSIKFLAYLITLKVDNSSFTHVCPYKSQICVFCLCSRNRYRYQDRDQDILKSKTVNVALTTLYVLSAWKKARFVCLSHCHFHSATERHWECALLVVEFNKIFCVNVMR